MDRRKEEAGPLLPEQPGFETKQQFQQTNSNKGIADKLSTAAISLAGLKLLLPDICPACNSRALAIIAANQADLQCCDCAAPRGRIGPKTRSFILNIFNRFGCPREITLRRSIGEIESTDLFLPTKGGRLIGDQLARRRRLSRPHG